ncbi:phosphatidylinositol 4-phosphate 5-kinase 1 [Nymphaea colorata]|uniref:phosphatidylinositol 4-phosphate 5-kinase 1 n=1 Tax=Nymphaea colorata TaxID=210225 RepID=UPI00129D86FA|nr:phosphatidylinositol 4-phosphate 5-kinase 1 [Nymphaea colorata]
MTCRKEMEGGLALMEKYMKGMEWRSHGRKLRIGLKEGHGLLTLADGSAYEGEFHNNKMEGYGHMTWSDGKEYEGFWKKDRMNGKGNFLWPDGRRYEDLNNRDVTIASANESEDDLHQEDYECEHGKGSKKGGNKIGIINKFFAFVVEMQAKEDHRQDEERIYEDNYVGDGGIYHITYALL